MFDWLQVVCQVSSTSRELVPGLLNSNADVRSCPLGVVEGKLPPKLPKGLLAIKNLDRHLADLDHPAQRDPEVISSAPTAMTRQRNWADMQ